MKKIFVLFILLIMPSVFGQNLTLSELLSIRKKDISGVDDYLTNKSWKFISGSEPDDESLGSISYTFKKDYMNDKAESFLNYYYSDYSSKTRLSIQVHKTNIINAYISQIKIWGGKIIDSYVDDGDMIKIYQGSTMTYRVITSTQDNDYGGTSTCYILSIYTNEDFNSM
ncbi:MAG: hypothetical protein RR578_02920 [Bacilli bacterium]|uniref:hypothetical protein n=1 Tax=Algoriella sp. TaxID=1872434 RepID=UPI002FC59018